MLASGIIFAFVILGGAAEPKRYFKIKRSGPYTVTVNYAKKLDEMVAEGSYDAANGCVSEEHFALYGSGAISADLELVHFGEKIETPEILIELKKNGLEPAYIEHLLAFGAQYREERGRYEAIVALGSPGAIVIGGEEREYEDDENGGIKERKKPTIIIEPIVAYLGGAGNHEVDCLGFEGPGLQGWSTDYYFLAMPRRKKK